MSDLDETVLELGGALQDSIAILEAEAGELATRRPHPDGHLYDVEAGLRYRAEQATATLEEHYNR